MRFGYEAGPIASVFIVQDVPGHIPAHRRFRLARPPIHNLTGYIVLRLPLIAERPIANDGLPVAPVGHPQWHHLSILDLRLIEARMRNNHTLRWIPLRRLFPSIPCPGLQPLARFAPASMRVRIQVVSTTASPICAYLRNIRICRQAALNRDQTEYRLPGIDGFSLSASTAATNCCHGTTLLPADA